MNEVLTKLVFLSAISQREFPDAVLKIFAETLLKELSESDAVRACDLWIKKSKTHMMPTPAQLIEMVRPSFSDRGEASMIAMRIHEIAMKRGTSWADDAVFINGQFKYMGNVGEYHDTWDDACFSLLGPAGFEVVRRMGGWKRACRSFFESDPGVVRAQVRDLAEMCFSKARAGTLDKPVELPNSEKQFSLVKDLNVAIGWKEK